MPGKQTATIRFEAGWSQEKVGDIVQGGRLVVLYAAERLPDCRAIHNRRATWDLFASALFTPGGQLESGSVAKGEFQCAVPGDATDVSLWFQNVDGSGCTAWDSRYGENYRFAVTPAQSTVRSTRRGSAPSISGKAAASSAVDAPAPGRRPRPKPASS